MIGAASRIACCMLLLPLLAYAFSQERPFQRRRRVIVQPGEASSSSITASGWRSILEAQDRSTVEATNEDAQSTMAWSYLEFAKRQPFANNILISTTKTTAADFLAQTVFSQTPLSELDINRSLLFAMYGALYLGGFQYLYQVGVFNKLFDVKDFTSLPWREKLEDKEGLKALLAQVVLDMTVVAIIALPVFYTFKACVFGGVVVGEDPIDMLKSWTSTGLDNYHANFLSDEEKILKVWVPANLFIFSVPLYLRLPARHTLSFVWTTYFSLIRGGG